jgi:hypothetical protein
VGKAGSNKFIGLNRVGEALNRIAPKGANLDVTLSQSQGVGGHQ